jgi:putative salt-induced outer membrane protein YdiY
VKERLRFVPVIVLALMSAMPCWSQTPPPEEKKLGWADSADLSYVLTSGNTDTRTLGFKNLLTRTWENALFALKAGGIRSQAATPPQFALSVDPDPNTVDPNNPSTFTVEDGDLEVTAENYFLNGAYDRNVSKAFYWHVGAGWDKNTFAGIQNRYVGEVGVGNIWFDADRRKWRTTYSATYTNQDEVVDNPEAKNNFAGARIASDFMMKFGESTTFIDTLVFDENLDETSDWRVDMINSVAVAMNQHLALKVSLQWLYDNEPSLKNVPIFTSTGGVLTDSGLKVPVQLDELDTIFTTSLVVTW